VLPFENLSEEKANACRWQDETSTPLKIAT
jgi:hypothetical protein